MKTVSFFILLTIVFACTHDNKKVHYPSRNYHYVTIDTAKLIHKGLVYVPVYSHIYAPEGSQALNLTATLSIRNISYTDSFYVTDVTYYGSQGEVLKNYLTSSLVVRPMSSIEFVVEQSETKGGAGANFVVRWGAADSNSKPLVQAVMSGINTGVSFAVDGVEMK